MPAIAVTAPAKINLTLRVVGRRPDGYHLIESLVVFAEIHDLIEARPAERLSLTVDGPFARALSTSEGQDPAADNLVLRAAHALQDAFGVRRGAELRLVKNLPVAAGIGGGSADAAATLRALCRLWDLTPSEAELAAIGLRLGADVPVCLAGRSALMTGVGETVTPVPTLPHLGILLVNPGTALSTAAVFQARTGPFSPPTSADPLFQCAAGVGAAQDAARLARLLAQYDNDLADAAARLAPAIPDVLAAIHQTSGCLLARLSGSGATCFGLYAEAGAAEVAAAQVAAAHPGWWMAATHLRTDQRGT